MHVPYVLCEVWHSCQKYFEGEQQQSMYMYCEVSRDDGIVWDKLSFLNEALCYMYIKRARNSSYGLLVTCIYTCVLTCLCFIHVCVCVIYLLQVSLCGSLRWIVPVGTTPCRPTSIPSQSVERLTPYSLQSKLYIVGETLNWGA